MLHWMDETRWQPLSEIVARLKRRVEAAIEAGDSFEGELAHDELTAAEHRLRMAERSKEKARQRANASGHDRQEKERGDD